MICARTGLNFSVQIVFSSVSAPGNVKRGGRKGVNVMEHLYINNRFAVTINLIDLFLNCLSVPE